MQILCWYELVQSHSSNCTTESGNEVSLLFHSVTLHEVSQHLIEAQAFIRPCVLSCNISDRLRRSVVLCPDPFGRMFVTWLFQQQKFLLLLQVLPGT